MSLLSTNPSFARLWGGEVLSEVGSQVTTIAMPLLALSLTGSPAEAGLVGVARSVAIPLSSLPAGVIADRLDRRRLMLGCALGRGLVLGSIPVVLAFGSPPLSQLLLVALLDAVMGVASYVAERGLLTQLVPAPELPEAVTLNEGRSAAATLVGPPLGGALFGLARGLPFLADALSFFVAFAAFLGLRVPGQTRPADRGEVSRGLRAAREGALEGLRWLWSDRFMRASSLLYSAANVTLTAVELLGILILRGRGASSAAIGLAFAIVGAGGLAGAALADRLRRRMHARAGVLLEPWSYVLLLPLLLAFHSPLAVGLIVGLMFVPLTLSSSIVVGRRLALTPGHLRGRVQAGGSFLASSISWVGPLAIGLLVEYAGETAAVLALLGWALVTAILATLAPGLRHIPPLPEPPQTPVASA